MPSLDTVQKQFCNALITKDQGITSYLHSTHAAARLDIYRQTIRENCRHALFTIYPGIGQLVGEDCANNLAGAFSSSLENLPTSGCLDEWGESFSAFIKTITPLQTLPYLADYALFEWQQHLAYGANEEAAMCAEDFQQISKEKWADICIQFVNNLFFFHSSYPIDKIQGLLNNPQAPQVSLNEGACYCLIIRKNNTVYTHWIDKSHWLFLQALSQKQTLMHAFSHLPQTGSQTEFTEKMSFLIKNALIKHVFFTPPTVSQKNKI